MYTVHFTCQFTGKNVAVNHFTLQGALGHTEGLFGYGYECIIITHDPIEDIIDAIDTEDATEFSDSDDELLMWELEIANTMEDIGECEVGVNIPTYGGKAW